jgi:protein phosphatase
MTGVDVIGDVHGCAEELGALLHKLGYVNGRHPKDRKIVLVGDLVDRGPRNLEVLRMAMSLVSQGHESLMGNHDFKLLRYLLGNKVKIGRGLEVTVEELKQVTDLDRWNIQEFLRIRPYTFRWRPRGLLSTLCVSHAGIPFDMIGEDTKKSRVHSIYGEVDGFDEHGLPRRTFNFYKSWEFKFATLVHGHTKTTNVFPTQDVVNVDTGCYAGGSLTAYRFPEHEIVQVPSLSVYRTSSKTRELWQAR